MESRRRNNHRRSQNRKPPRCSWQPTVPSWEIEFCKVIGSIDWDTLLQMKKFMHLYDNIIEWNDSAAKEAFNNAKRRYWAEKNSLSCDIPLPDPDLYIDKINWDSDMNSETFPNIEIQPISPKVEEDQDHVVIFGDFAMPNQDFAATGWGEDDENLVADRWGHSSNECAAATWQGHPNDGWQYNSGGGHDYIEWEGNWSNWNWNYDNNYNYVGPVVGNTWTWDGDNNVPMAGSGGRVSSFTTVQANEQQTWDWE